MKIGMGGDADMNLTAMALAIEAGADLSLVHEDGEFVVRLSLRDHQFTGKGQTAIVAIRRLAQTVIDGEDLPPELVYFAKCGGDMAQARRIQQAVKTLAEVGG